MNAQPGARSNIAVVRTLMIGGTTTHYYLSKKCTITAVLSRAGPPPNLAIASDVNNGRPFGFGGSSPDQYLKLLRNNQMEREANTTQLLRDFF